MGATETLAREGPTFVVAPEIVKAGETLVAKIWENVENYSPENPRRANRLSAAAIESLAEGDGIF